MKVGDQYYRTIWHDEQGRVSIIDQTVLPHRFSVVALDDTDAAAAAIRDMLVRGAPLIGATAAYGLYLAMRDDPSDAALAAAAELLIACRPTAVNLRWAVERVSDALIDLPAEARCERSLALAASICDEDVAICSSIGDHGLTLIEALAAQKKPGEAVNILTHCNAGWLATVDWGTAIAPIYKAHERGIPVHVWVDETRPRNQGAHLTAWELSSHGVAHTLIVDNVGGHLMQRGLVDICFVGTDRTTAAGDVCNKIGTYLKALAATDNDVPFYVCAPSPSIDWRVQNGLADIPIEQRGADEVTHVSGLTDDGDVARVAITTPATPARNDAFDVTPARLVTGLVTERGIVKARADALAAAFPDLALATAS